MINQDLTKPGDAGVRELIPPRDGKLEDKLVLIGSTLVIALAFLLLSTFYSDNQHAKALVPKALRQHLISLSNAAEELSMMSELEGQLPSLDDIANAGIEPFSQNALPGVKGLTWRQYGHCFLARTNESDKQYQLRLIMLAEQSEKYELAWRSARTVDLLEAEACKHTKQGWQIIDKYNRLNKASHEH